MSENARLKSFVQRIERMEEEIAERNADKKEIYAEAKGTGYCVKTIKLLVAERRKEPQALAEQNEMLDLYRAAMNGTEVALTHTPAPAPARPKAAPAQVQTPHDADGVIIEQNATRPDAAEIMPSLPVARVNRPEGDRAIGPDTEEACRSGVKAPAATLGAVSNDAERLDTGPMSAGERFESERAPAPSPSVIAVPGKIVEPVEIIPSSLADEPFVSRGVALPDRFKRANTDQVGRA